MSRTVRQSIFGAIPAPSLLVVLFSVVAVATAGCANITESDVDQVEPTFELPENWHHDGDVGELVDDDWCDDFGQPELGEVIDRVYEHNLDLRVARARIREARALLARQRSRRLPNIGIGAEVDGELGPDGWETQYEVSMPASYEVDLWGRIGHRIAAADTELEATETDLRTVAMALAAETAEQYYELARIRAELDLLDEQIRAAKTFLDLTEVRQAQGMAEGLDVVQQRQQIDELHELRRRARLDEQLAVNALATLMGLPPGQINIPQADELPDEIPPITDARPPEILDRRPDIRAARLRVAAAGAHIDAAAAERLPRLVLTPGLALQALNPAGLFNYLFVTVLGEAAQSIWEGGRIRAQIDENEAIYQQRLFEFSQIALQAIREVEDTLARGEGLYDILQIQRRQLDSAEEALEMARQQYRAGILDYLRVLTALQSLHELQAAELDSRRAVLYSAFNCAGSPAATGRPHRFLETPPTSGTALMKTRNYESAHAETSQHHRSSFHRRYRCIGDGSVVDDQHRNRVHRRP